MSAGGPRGAFSYIDALIWTLGLTSALALGIWSTQALFRRASVLWVGVVIEVLLYVGASFVLGGRRDARRVLGFSRAPLGLLLAGAALGVLLHGVTGLIQLGFEQLSPTPEAELDAQIERLAKGGLAERVLVGLSACVLAPFAEELFFRGALHARLAPGRPALPVLFTTSVCFALSHLEPRNWVSLAIVGLALGQLRRASGSLVPCYLLHAAFNATTLVLLWSDPNPTSQNAPSLYLLGGVGAVALGLFAWVSRRARAAGAVT